MAEQSKDIVTEFSQIAGDPGLDSPRVFTKEPAPPEPLLQFDGRSVFMSDDPEAPKKIRSKYIPHARVFVVGEEGNSDYEEILLKGANGEIMLGRKEVTDIRGSLAYKVYQEWIVTEKPKKEGTKERG